jgi:Ni,Fe-hydrogenase III large subunit
VSDTLVIRNPDCRPVADLPLYAVGAFRRLLLDGVAAGGRLAALTALPACWRPGGDRVLLAVIANDDQGELGLFAGEVGTEYPSLTPDCPQAHWFEREIHEQAGIVPRGHPWLKPIRFLPGGAEAIGRTGFFRMAGEEVHEVAVGPVHAGVIEPGHFRFQCHGETVYHLEISLGYQHRGVERALVGGPDRRCRHLIETLAGDTTVGHATVHALVMESLAGARVPVRAEAIRAIAAEWERIANHLGDLGALAGDVGFLPTQNYCGRIRGDALNLTAMICGNRFGRGLVLPGGVSYDLDADRIGNLRKRLAALGADARSAVGLMFDTTSVLARFEGTGRVAPEVAAAIGLVGPAARASGLGRDVRHHHPYGLYRFAHLPDNVLPDGDCLARALVRWLEIQHSLTFIDETLSALPAGEIAAALPPPRPGRLAVAMAEGWRGEICHLAVTGDAGRFAHYKVVDPSFHNWFGLAMSLRDQQISDFPLCNKSFNLSYCGHDL